MATGDPENEYKDVSENIRWHTNMRFLQMTLFFGATAFLLNATQKANPPFSSLVCGFVSVIGIVGIFTSSVFGSWNNEQGTIGIIM